MADITGTWNRIVAWLESNASQVLGQHQKGVTDAELNELENTIGCELPDDAK